VNSFIPRLQEQPLWRPQKIGKKNLDFLYGPSTDSRSIQLRPGVAYCFRKFHPLIQDIVQSAWPRAVRSMNGAALGEQKFLFGSERNALLAIRPLLTDLQNGLCFYCSCKVGPTDGEIDNFVRWSRCLPISRTTWSLLSGNLMDRSGIG